MSAPRSIPPKPTRDNIMAALVELVQAIESHPDWTPPSPPKSLFHVWDFVNRSCYIMSELDNLYEGTPVARPEQIPPNPRATTGPEAAAASFTDVCSRAMTIDQMIQNPRMMAMLGLSSVEFGDNIRRKSRAVNDIISSCLS